MILFLYGRDNFRSLEKLNEIINHYKTSCKSGLNFRRIEKENLDFGEFEIEFKTNSMFKEKKLFVLEGVFSDKEFKENFLEKKENFAVSDNVILIYELAEIAKTDSLFKYLQKNSKSQEFNPLEGENLLNWIKKECTALKVKIGQDAATELVLFAGNDLWRLKNEIRKLAGYKAGGEIKKEDITLLVKPKIENDIFKTIDALTEKKKDRALLLLHRHLSEGDAPLYLLSMICFQFRNILSVKDLLEKNFAYPDIVSKTKLHPFVVRKSYLQAQRFTLPQLKKIYQNILLVDLSLKTGKMDSETALDMLIVGI